MNFKLFVKPQNKLLIGSIATAIAIASGITIYGIYQNGQIDRTPTSKSIQTKPIAPKVTALGRLEPFAEVIKLSAPLALNGDRVAELLVEEGDRVKAGQVIAILDSRDRLQDAVQEAQERVKVSRAKLAQVKAGAKLGEIQAQKEQISRLQAELIGEIKTQDSTIARNQAQVNNARSEYNRHQKLYRDGAIAISILDSKRLAFETAYEQLNEAQATQDRTNDTLKAQLAEARANLNSISEVRPVDLQAVQTEVDSAIAALKRSKTDLSQVYIRAPIDSQILKIQTRSGEKIEDAGIVELAQTDFMIAVAEVYQSDISKVKLGQPAEITGQAFDGIVRGKECF
jgi:HlyD family secretion protein